MKPSDLSSRLIAPFGNVTDESHTDFRIDVNAGSLLKTLLLFETFVLQTRRFKELVALVRSIGIDNTLALLESGALRIQAEPTVIFNSGQVAGAPGIRTKPPLALGSFEFSRIVSANHKDYVSLCFEGMQRELGDVPHKQMVRLKRKLAEVLEPCSADAGRGALEATVQDLRRNSPVARTALALALHKERGIPLGELDERDLGLLIRPIDETDFVTEWNAGRFGITSQQESHRLVESALLAVGSLNLRIEEMERHNAVSGSIDGELPMFEGKLNFLRESLSPNRLAEEFDRILKVCEIPSLDLQPVDHTFDVRRFLETRSSREAAEFRSSLRAGALTQHETREAIIPLSERFGAFVTSGTGKSWRLAIQTIAGIGLSALGPAGTIIGAALGTIDSFLIERVFPVSGPVIFLSRQLPSVFDKRRE